jgi:hypothetical protein
MAQARPVAGVRRHYYYPEGQQLPAWAEDLVRAAAVLRRRSNVADTRRGQKALSLLAPRLVKLGYRVEKKKREVSFPLPGDDAGTDARRGRRIELDAFHDKHGIMVEIEGDWSAFASALERDLIRASILAPRVRYLAVGMPLDWFRKSGLVQPRKRESPFERAADLLRAIFREGSKLKLPLEGVLLFGTTASLAPSR